MKNFFKYITVTPLIAFVFYSCSKDLGNYDYTDANVITITTDMANVDPAVVINNDSLVVKQNDSLKVNILISQTKPSNGLAYEWMIIQSSSTIGNPAQYVVGNAAQLRTKIILSPNLYKLVVKVTDKTTGVSFYKFYSLNVDTSPWGGEGWVVLQDQAAQGCDISVITTRDGVVRGNIYSNVYSLANGHKLPTGTYKVNVMNYGTALRIQKVSFFYPTGGTQVRSTDYLDSSYANGWFVNLPSVINFESTAVGPVSGQHEILINNGQLQYQVINASSIKTPPIVFGAPLIGSWPSLSPYFMPNSSGIYCTFFDKVNRCFLHINLSNNTLIPTTQIDAPNQHWPAYSGAGGATNLTVTGKGFDLNNIGRNLIYSENAQLIDGAVNHAYYCIFRNSANDSTFLYQFTSGSTGIANNNITGRYFLKDAATNVTGINTASIFAVPAFSIASVSNVFYYVPGNSTNSIYVCNPSYTTGGGILPATTVSHSGYSFPAGTIIKTMKVFKSGYATAPSTESRVLVVATDETASGAGHKVYFFNLTGTGEINTTPANVYTGFDKIVDIAFKKGLGF